MIPKIDLFESIFSTSIKSFYTRVFSSPNIKEMNLNIAPDAGVEKIIDEVNKAFRENTGEFLYLKIDHIDNENLNVKIDAEKNFLEHFGVYEEHALQEILVLASELFDAGHVAVVIENNKNAYTYKITPHCVTEREVEFDKTSLSKLNP